ncbi:hypothetical protein [Streptomyces griseus]|nr:hypothetical protein [Streptomyces fimicarius]
MTRSSRKPHDMDNVPVGVDEFTGSRCAIPHVLEDTGPHPVPRQ